MKLRIACLVFGFLSLVLLTLAQTSTQTPSALPRLVRFGGTAKDLNGNALTGIVGITFALYSEQTGGASLWLETQNVTADGTGHYIALLGSTKPEGLPADLFTSEQAHWVGVQVSGQAEQARVLLVSAPYALKAGDAETIGGLPPSAFVLVAPAVIGSASGSVAASSTADGISPATTSDVTTTGGTVDAIPLFSSATNIQNSILTQTGTTAINIGGKLNLPATGAATATAGKDSAPLDFVASSFNSASAAAVNQTFQWQAEPAANDTTTPSGTLNLLYGLGTAAPSETGLKLSSKGIFTFATGQTFPGTGAGTITGVIAGTDLTGGGTTGTVTLNLNTTKIPQLATANTFIGSQTVTGNVTASAEVQGKVVNATTSFDIAGTPFAFGSTANSNAFLGFAGNSTMTGKSNTASGFQALFADTTGYENTAIGAGALSSNTTGAYNVAIGQSTLAASTSGFANTGVGNSAGSTIDASALTGKNNTALGTGSAFSTGSLINATAIGANAVVSESNSLVLGSISGVNGQTITALVGIGTTAPGAALDVISGQTQGPGGRFQGFIAAASSGYGGGDGIDSTGGNADLESDDTGGGNGITAVGAGGVNDPIFGGGDGAGGSFAGGDNGSAGGSTGDGVFAIGGSGQAGYFSGDVFVAGSISSTESSSTIDHPLDPANKYLSHSFVESPDMMNIYNGNVVLDEKGEAVVELPQWFDAINRDFRYQLTCIGGFAPVYVADEIGNNRFRIAGGKAEIKVSWQVTGVRQDAWANAHRVPVEQEKELRERGFYIHPELYGAPEQKRIAYARHPQTMKKIQAMRAKQQATIKAAMKPVAAPPK
jgi:trimeric autotransporter adhesin